MVIMIVETNQMKKTAMSRNPVALISFIARTARVYVQSGVATVTRTVKTTQMSWIVAQQAPLLSNVTGMNFSVRTAGAYLQAGAVMAKRIVKTIQMNWIASQQVPLLSNAAAPSSTVVQASASGKRKDAMANRTAETSQTKKRVVSLNSKSWVYRV